MANPEFTQKHALDSSFLNPRTIIIAAVLLAAYLGGYLLYIKPGSFSELDLYVLAGQRLARGETIHRTDERAFAYPPLFAVPFVLFAELPQWSWNPLWYSMNVLPLAFIFFRLHRRLLSVIDSSDPATLPSKRLRMGLFWFLLILLAGRHVLSPLENKSHDLLVFLAVFLAIEAWCSRHTLLSGIASALGAALKATPLLFAPYYLWQRKFAAFATMMVALAVFTFLPDVLFPANDGNSWTITWCKTYLGKVAPGESADSAAWDPAAALNQSVAGTMYRLFTPPQPHHNPERAFLFALSPFARKCVTMFAQLAIFGWLLWVTRPSLSRNMQEPMRSMQHFGEGAVLVTAMVLLSPTSIKTHFCVLLLPIAFCLMDFLFRRRLAVVGGTLLICLALAFTVKDLTGKALGDFIMSAGSVTWSTVAVLIATGWILLDRARMANHAFIVEAVPIPNDREGLIERKSVEDNQRISA